MALIEVNDDCNAGCTFCGIERRGLKPADEIRGGLASAAVGGLEEITFGGGEPTLDPRLGQWLQEARELGFVNRKVETNGMRFSDEAYLGSMVAAGLTHGRVMIPAADEEIWEAVTRLPGRMDLAWTGAAKLLDAEICVDLVVPVSQTNVGSLTGILERAKSELVGLGAVHLRPVFFTSSGGGDSQAERKHAEILELAQSETLSIAELADSLVRAVTEGKGLGLEVRLDLAGGLPLCSLRRSPDALAAIAGRRVTYEFGEACGDCAMFERCSGLNPVTIAAHGPYETRPFDRIPAALTRNTNPEPIVVFSDGLPSYRYGAGEKAEIRVVMPCNQDCTFCFVNRDAPNATVAELEAAVDVAVQRGVGAVVFTGGEPTLSRHLAGLIARAQRGGVPCRGIQTNALRLTDPALVAELVDAGLNHAHVSLHSCDLEQYLQITGFGSPDEGARGAANLAKLGVELSISLVICKANAPSIGETIAFIHSHVPEARVVLAVAREQYGLDRPWDETLVGFGEAATALGVALTTARSLGLTADVAGTCCLPPCVLEEDVLGEFGELFLMGHREARWQGTDDGEEEIANTVSNDFAQSCKSCALYDRCPGITRMYLERHGEAEFQPISSDRARSLGLV